MADLRPDAAAFQIIQRLGEAPVLQPGEGHVCRIPAVGHAEVHKGPLHMEMRQIGCLNHLLQGRLRTIGREADAGHARIQFQMGIENKIGAVQGVVQFPGILQGMDLLGQIQIDHIFGIQGRRIAQDQNGRADPAPAQLHGLLQVGHRQVGSAQLHQGMTHRHGPMTIGVGLHDPQKLAVPGNVGANGAIVMGQGVQIHAGPGSLQ